MISSAAELLHQWTCLLRLCFLAPGASNISGEAGLETSHLTLSHICANHFDTGKSTQPGSARGLLCSAENCLPAIGSHEEYARNNIFVREQWEPITLCGQWSLWKQHGLAWQQGTTHPPIHPSLEGCGAQRQPQLWELGTSLAIGTGWSKAEILACKWAWHGRTHGWTGQGCGEMETNVLWCHWGRVWQPQAGLIWDPRPWTGVKGDPEEAGHAKYSPLMPSWPWHFFL